MRTGIRRQVHPLVAAILVIGVLVAVQYAWWKGLVYKPPIPQGPPGGPTGPQITPVTSLSGHTDVTVDTLAGDVEPGDADGPGHTARFDRPTGLAIDAQGNVYVADTGNHRIRKITPDGTTTTLAGGTQGNADGPASQAKFDSPCGVCVTPNGVVYVADTGNKRLRVIRSGQVTTLGSDSSGIAHLSVAWVPMGGGPWLATGSAGYFGAQFFHPDNGGRKAQEPSVVSRPDNHPSTGIALGGELAQVIPGQGTVLLGTHVLHNLAIQGSSQPALALRRPVGITAMAGDWLVTDANHGAVLTVRNGSVEVLAGTCTSAEPMRGYRDADGSKALFGAPTGIVTDNKGHIYVADTANNMIRRITL